MDPIRRRATRGATGTVRVPAYDRLDAGASWLVSSAPLRSSLMLKVLNLTDRRYWRMRARPTAPTCCFRGLVRELWLGLTIQDRL